MNIIQVCPYDLSKPGGVQNHITHLSNELVKRNHNVLVLAPIITNSDFENNFDCKLIATAEVTRIKLFWGTTADLSYLRTDAKNDLKRTLKEFNPDLVHFHTIWSPAMPKQVLDMVNPEVRKIITCHDTPPDRGFGKFVAGSLLRLSAKYYLPKVDEIISVSKIQARSMGVADNNYLTNFQIIPNGVHAHPEKVRSTQEVSHNDEFRLIFVGRFEKRKGLMDLLEVYARLEKELNDKKISLLILGDGPYKKKAQSYIRENDLSNVSFIHETNETDKNEWMTKADLLVAPSLYGESFGIILLEAMALKLKVAGYGNPGYLKVVSEYGPENFPSPGNKDKLLQVLKEHILNPERSDHLIKKGVKIAEEHDWKKIAERVEKVYNKVTQ